MRKHEPRAKSRGCRLWYTRTTGALKASSIERCGCSTCRTSCRRRRHSCSTIRHMTSCWRRARPDQLLRVAETRPRIAHALFCASVWSLAAESARREVWRRHTGCVERSLSAVYIIMTTSRECLTNAAASDVSSVRDCNHCLGARHSPPTLRTNRRKDRDTFSSVQPATKSHVCHAGLVHVRAGWWREICTRSSAGNGAPVRGGREQDKANEEGEDARPTACSP